MVFLIIVLTALINVVLGVISLKKGPKSATHILLATMTFIIALWTVTNYFSLHSATGEETLFWIRVVMFVTAPLGPVVYLFCKAFPRKELRINRYLLGWFIGATLLLELMAFTPLLFSGVSLENGVNPTPGPGILLFGANFILPILAGFVEIIRKYRHSFGLEKLQLKYLLWGIIVSFGLQILTNFLFVVVLKFSDLVILGPIFSLIMVGCIFYAVVRHRLLEIRLVIIRSVVYSLLLIALAAFYAVDVLLINNYFFQLQIDGVRAAIFSFLALFIAITFQPLKKLLEDATESIFFKNRYKSNEAVLQLTKIMASTLHLDELSRRLLHYLLKTLHISGGAFVLFRYVVLRDGKEYEIIREGVPDTTEYSHQIINELFYQKRMLIYDEEKDGRIKHMLRSINASIVLPLYDDTHDQGLLILGERKSGDPYTQQDINLLQIFGPEVSVAIQNAKSFDEINRFNITLRNEVEKATKDLKIANQRLKELDILKDEFVSVASHELRTPMTAIKSYLWMALDGRGGPLTEKQKYYIERGYTSVDRLIKLVNDMLNISRIESGRLKMEMQAVTLDKLITEVIEEMLPRAKELGIELILDNKDDVPPVLADPGKIREVLINLIGNSLKFTSSGGSITIALSVTGGMVETKVTDTGDGISPEELPRLFQKFGLLPGSYAANQAVSGTGLGLYICRSLVELHEGQIWAKSDGRGKGTSFSFTLKLFSESDLREFIIKNNNKMKDDRLSVARG